MRRSRKLSEAPVSIRSMVAVSPAAGSCAEMNGSFLLVPSDGQSDFKMEAGTGSLCVVEPQVLWLVSSESVPKGPLTLPSSSKTWYNEATGSVRPFRGCLSSVLGGVTLSGVCSWYLGGGDVPSGGLS